MRVDTSLFALTLLALACGQKAQPEPVKNDLNSAEVIAVRVAPVQSANANGTVTATGLMTTENETRYSFKLGGVIDRVAVKEGQAIKKGQLLATLKLNEIDAGIAQNTLGIEKAQRDLTRAENLYRDSVATLEQVQNARTALDLVKRQMDGLQFNRQYAAIYATSAGFVTKKLASEGEVIGGGYPLLAVNESTGAGWVLRVGMSDQDWAAVAVGQSADIEIDAFAGRKFAGRVSNKSQAADQRSGSFQVDVQVQLKDAKPALGMYGKATIKTGRTAQHPTIPYDALIEADGAQAFVFVPEGGTRVRKQPIRIGTFNQQGVQVLSGLEGVREVVISNSAFLSERSTIQIAQ
jgi:RND family efflux transporter MFP subunit